MQDDTTIAALNEFLRATHDAREFKRALAVKLALLDYDYTFIAEMLCVDLSFISKWKRIFREQGIDALLLQYKGYHGRLTTEQRQAVIDWIKAQNTWDIDTLIAHVDQVYHIRFKSKQSYYALYAEAGITWKRTMPQRPQKNPAVVEAKKKEIETHFLKHFDTIQHGDLIVYFLDECHLLWGDILGYAWGPRGERIYASIKNERQRQTYFGALNMLTGQVVIEAYKTANSDNTVDFLKQLQARHRGKQLLILWDGASYHYQGAMIDYLTDINANCTPDTWRIHCILFAPYAPEQNPIEDVWLIGKRAIRKRFAIADTFKKVKNIFVETIKDTLFQFAKIFMYMPKFVKEI
jgi:transposase